MLMAPKTLVLYFHRISDEVSPAFPPMPVKVFEQVLQFLKKRYFIIPLEEIGQSFQSKRTRLIITFDDAFLDFYENALPLLVKHQVPALQNIITQCAETGEPLWTQKLNKMVEVYFREGRENELVDFFHLESGALKKADIGNIALKIYRQLLEELNREELINRMFENLGTRYKETKMMGWRHIRDSMKHGVSIGSHTHSHQNLTLLNDGELIHELHHSAKLIEERTGKQPVAIAYPNGRFDERVINRSMDVGYQFLLTVEERIMRKSELNDRSTLLIPRFNVYHTSYWKNYLKLNYINWQNSKPSWSAGILEELSRNNDKIEVCPVCKSADLKELKGFSKVFLTKCARCSFVFSRKKPSLEELTTFYDQYSYGEDYYSSPITRKRFNELLTTFEPYRQTNRLLDVGCGTGDFLLAARDRGWECSGTEFSPKAVEICRKKGLNVLQGDLKSLTGQLPVFDVITSFEVIEHINTPREEMETIKEHLRPGGMFYLTTPNFNSLIRMLLGNRYDAIVFPEHLSYFSPTSLKFLMHAAGFHKIKLITTGFSFSRFRNALFSRKENPFTSKSTDEKFRIAMESGMVFRGIKASIDWLFTFTGTGLSMKGWFEKRSP